MPKARNIQWVKVTCARVGCGNTFDADMERLGEQIYCSISCVRRMPGPPLPNCPSCKVPGQRCGYYADGTVKVRCGHCGKTIPRKEAP